MEKEEMIPVAEYCTHYSVEITFIRSLQEAGLVRITTLEDEHYLPYEELGSLEKFIRLHHDLHINTEGIEAISHMLERMEAMQQEIANLKNRLGIYEQ
jgi:chaperone modulatory protein CbpM